MNFFSVYRRAQFVWNFYDANLTVTRRKKIKNLQTGLKAGNVGDMIEIAEQRGALFLDLSHMRQNY